MRTRIWVMIIITMEIPTSYCLKFTCFSLRRDVNTKFHATTQFLAEISKIFFMYVNEKLAYCACFTTATFFFYPEWPLLNFFNNFVCLNVFLVMCSSFYNSPLFIQRLLWEPFPHSDSPVMRVDLLPPSKCFVRAFFSD